LENNLNTFTGMSRPQLVFNIARKNMELIMAQRNQSTLYFLARIEKLGKLGGPTIFYSCTGDP
jgi:hypothetical protein